MRHKFLSLIVAFLAAIACFVLLPVRVAWFGFEVDTFTWIFVGPLLFVLLLAITITVGFVAFLVSKAKLPDRGWRSAQTFVILLTFVATVSTAAVIAWLHFAEPAGIGPEQSGLPTLHLARILTPADTRWSSARLLAWSADGERLASYTGAGINTWSPDGKYHKEFSLHQNFPSKIVLRYLSGHRLLITSPVTEDNSAEERDRLEDKAFSVLDAETGKVLQVVPGPHPGGRAPDNEANDLAISPDERFVAVICGRQGTQVNIYSTEDWTQVATLAVGDTVDAHGLAFSPDGRALAVFFGRRGSRIKFFEVSSWSLSGSLEAYPDSSPAMGVVGLSALSFSPDGAMIAVGASSGGSWWTYPEGTTVLPGIGVLLPGTGVLKIYFPADPLRIYRIVDGSLVASLGSFPGGFSLHGLVWSPNGKYLAFQDGVGGIRFWNPFQPDLSVVVARKGVLPLPSIQFSKDGSQLAADSWDGLKVFDVVPPR